MRFSASLLALLLGTCHPGKENDARYQSPDKSAVFIVQGGYAYLGTPNFPPSSNAIMTYGTAVTSFADGVDCTSYAGLLIPHKIVDGSYCHGEQTKIRKSSNSALEFSIICWSFSKGICHRRLKESFPAREIVYDVRNGEIRRIFLSVEGRANPGGSLLYTSGMPLRIKSI